DPTRVKVPVSRTRSSFTWSARGISPISSKKRVPSCAASKNPLRWPTEPVKAPFSCPNSSDSISPSGIAPQLTVTNGPLRSLRSWISSANTSLPVPLSPMRRTVIEVGAIARTTETISRISSLAAMICSGRGTVWLRGSATSVFPAAGCSSSGFGNVEMDSAMGISEPFKPVDKEFVSISREHLSERFGENAFAKFLEGDPGSARGIGDEARGGHPGERIDLEAVIAVVRMEPEIDAAVPAAPAGVERRERRGLDRGGKFRRELRRAGMKGHPGRVLMMIVVKAAVGLDLDDRERFVPEDRNGEFPAFDKFLDERFFRIVECEIDRALERVLGVFTKDREADGRSLVVRFNDKWEPEFGRAPLPCGMAFERVVLDGNDPAARNGNAGALHDNFRVLFIDTEHARSGVRAGKSFAQKFQDRLDEPVFTGNSMKPEHDDVGVAHGGGHQAFKHDGIRISG